MNPGARGRPAAAAPDAALGRGMDLLHRHLSDPVRPEQFTMAGQTWDLLDGVFCPTYTPVTELFTRWIPYPPGGRFAEVGSGAGVTAVVALQSGCSHACALDISAAAVENTGRNAVRHGVADRLRVLRSDLFSALSPDERFDMIYWNSNFVAAPQDFVNETDLHHAFFDPAYRAHRRYLRDAPRYLTPDGRLLLGFSSIGDTELLGACARGAGLERSVLATETRQLEITLEFQLLEFSPAGGRSWADLTSLGARQ